MSIKSLNADSWLTVKQMMNTNFKLLHLDDSLKTIIRYYLEYNLNALPVVDKNNKLIGVFPRKRLYRALLDGADLDEPCRKYVVYNPIYISSELTYDEASLSGRLSRSIVKTVVVVDPLGEVVGLIGATEYLRSSIDVIIRSNILLESLFKANYEAVIILDNKGYILRVNPAAEEIFQRSFVYIKGKHIHEILPEVKINNKKVFGIKTSINRRPVIVNQMPIFENEIFIGTIFTILDRSDVEKIANELEMVKEMQTTVKGILSTSDEGILVSDISGKIKYINERASELFLTSPENMVGRPIAEFIKNSEAEQAILNGSPEITEGTINARKHVIAHIPIQNKDENDVISGLVSKIYINDNLLTEQIALKLLSLKQQVFYYRSELEKQSMEGVFDKIFSKNKDFTKIKEDAIHISQSKSTVLLTGESGVGKDMFARAIHAASPRAKKPFVKVNCAAIPETLFESELFGYAPGSFTGALKKGKSGYFEQADKGTIFLDEIGEMPLSIQVKILQALQDKEFMAVGGTSPQNVDVRIIAATNKDLRQALIEGTFREDLFYRLNVIEFHLPPLRDRFEDIVPLAKLFINKYNMILGASIIGISDQACNTLKNHNWPGNIRELENAIERATNYAWVGEIDIEHLPTQITQKKPTRNESSYRAVLSDVDKEIIIETLAKTNNNKSAAAKILNLSRSAFYDKLKKYDIN